MTPRLLNLVRRAILALACLAFGAQLLIPPGYMPAPLSNGSLVRLCDALPMPRPASNHDADHGQHAAGDDDSSNHDGRWEHCPLGALAAQWAPTSAPTLAPSRPITGASCRHEHRQVVAVRPAAAYRPRGPPA